jgi:hypothetical protein
LDILDKGTRFLDITAEKEEKSDLVWLT